MKEMLSKVETKPLTYPLLLAIATLILVCLSSRPLSAGDLVGTDNQMLGESENYRITAVVLDGGGGQGTSGSYRLFDAVGDAVESAVSTSTNYRLYSGPVPALYPDGPPANFVSIAAPPDLDVTVSPAVTVTGQTAANALVQVSAGGAVYNATADAGGQYTVTGVILTPGPNPIDSRSTDLYGHLATTSVAITRTTFFVTGTLLSRVHDAGQPTTWLTMTWQVDTPAGTGLAFRTQTGDTPAPDGTWSGWSEVLTESGQTVSSPPGRYLQYQAVFTTADGLASPVLDEVTLRYEALLSYELALIPGWNLVSWPLAPVSSSMADTLASCSACDQAWAYDARDEAEAWKHWPGDLEQADEAMGLWLHVTDTVTLTLIGWQAASPTIDLRAGWNLVGYPSQTARPVVEALASIDGKYTRVLAYDASDPADPWKQYDVDAPAYANDLLLMEPGEGYWLYVTEDCTWTIEP